MCNDEYKFLLNDVLFILRVGTFGVLFDYGCEKKVSQHSVLGAAMSLGIPSGVTLKLKYGRFNS